MNRHIKNTVSICISFLFLVLQSCNSKREMGLEMLQLKKLEVEQIKPLHWWVGFQSEELQLLVKSNQIQGMKVTVNTPGVEITKVHNADSPNYLFIDLKIKKKHCSRKNSTAIFISR